MNEDHKHRPCPVLCPTPPTNLQAALLEELDTLRGREGRSAAPTPAFGHGSEAAADLSKVLLDEGLSARKSTPEEARLVQSPVLSLHDCAQHKDEGAVVVAEARLTKTPRSVFDKLCVKLITGAVATPGISTGERVNFGR